MLAEVTNMIVDINRQFYQKFGDAFAVTRRRIQPGVRKVLDGLPKEGHWLDLGCGSAMLAIEWIKSGRRGSYCGLDFSAELLAEAQHTLEDVAIPPGVQICFQKANLLAADWPLDLARRNYDGVFCFAALHHIPGSKNRLSLLQQVRALLPPGAFFVHSNWQFQNSPRLMARVQPWSTLGVPETELEPGDTLLDWRYILSGQPEQVGYRYVHQFSLEELAGLAAAAGFEIQDSFESDGEGGRLGLYQVWVAR